MAMPAVLSKKPVPRNAYRQPAKKQPAKPTPAKSVAAKSVAVAAKAHPTDATAMPNIRNGLLWFAGLGLVLLLVFALSMLLMKAFYSITSSSFFEIKEIRVQGVNQASVEEILAASQLEQGKNIFEMHIPAMEQALLQNPWVEKVAIKRMLPDTFIVDIKERVPQFWILREGTLYYLDSNGLIIAPVDSGNFRSLPTLDIGPGGEEAIPYLHDFLRALESKDLPFDIFQISWLRLSAGKGFELYWEKNKLSLCIGMEDWRQNLSRLFLVIDDLEKRKEIDKIREIRSSEGQVYLQKI